MRWLSVFVAAILFNSLLGLSLSNLEFDLETGLVTTGYNDVAIPGDSGDRFSLSEDLSAEGNLFLRLRLNYSLSSRSELSLLYAPLTVISAGRLSEDIHFYGKNFTASNKIDATFVFNSYRLTYKYRLWQNKKWQFKLGFTAKIRDAEIRLENDSISASKTNVGFVPIIYFSSRYQLTDKFNLELSGDALAAPQGRAEDILAAVFYRISPQWQLKFGYRLLEGGADNDEVYTFSLFHYAVLGIKYRY